MSDPISRLVQCLARLPGIGEKTATRLALHLVRAPTSQVHELAQALVDVVAKIRLCSICMNLTEVDPCGLCADARRDASTICVVATASDLMAIERGGGYRGHYHVLHGQLSPLEGIGPEDLRIDELIHRAEAGVAASGGEIILATAANVEGETTAMYLARLLKPLGVKVTRIASGLPAGGEIEYADQQTIARALDGRSEV
jgi:recombination protein RecR